MSIGHAWDPDMFEGVHALTTPIRTTDPSDYRKALIMYVLRDFAALAKLIDGQDFDHVWTVTLDRRVIDVEHDHEGYDVYAPDVVNDPDGDIEIMGEGWTALTGKTGQYSYHGAVMHPSEFIGERLAKDIAEMCDDAYEDGRKLAWTVVEVRDDDLQYPDGDPIGWVMVYRTI